VQLGLTEQDFRVAVTASQWASVKNENKVKMNQEAIGREDKAETNDDVLPDLVQVADTARKALSAKSIPPPTLTSDEFERTFSRQEKGELGLKLKQLLDLCRAARMQELGYDRVKLVRYTTRSIEDRLLVASVPPP
jgi:hypothetical protein